jgi:hypothetical protein
MKHSYESLVAKPEEQRPLGRPKRSWMTILKWILRKHDMRMWAGFVWLRIGAS